MAAELCSFSAAAKALRLSQAAVSQRIQAIERDLGKPLFRRQAGRVFLSAAGHRLYDYAQRILTLHQEARREIAGQDAAAVSELVLAASSVPGEHLLPVLLPRFGQEHPHVRIRASVTDSESVLARVRRGEVHLGLVGQKVSDPNLELRRFATDRMVLVVPAGHPLTARRKVPVRQLFQHPFIVREKGSGLRDCFEKALDRAGHSFADLSIALEIGSNEGIKTAVLQGAGIAVVSEHVVAKELQAGVLGRLEIAGLRCGRELFVVRDKRRALPLAARLFADFLQRRSPSRGRPSRPLMDG